ncbi:hypothetical protein FACS1894132_13460 [Clostridia bacterium]|nr:hypothetical protein FACS1894132_13460 [Clostridia bacterium]
MINDFATAIVSMILFVAIIIAISIVIKRYGKNGIFFGKQVGTPKNIKIIERSQISQSQSLLIIEVANQTMLLSVTNNHIEKITDISPDDLITSDVTSEKISFGKILENMKGKTNEDVDEKNS